MKMRRLIVALVSGALVLSFAFGCGKKEEAAPPAPAPEAAPAPAAPAMGGATTAAPAGK